MDSNPSNSINPYATPTTDLGVEERNYSHHPKASRFKRLVAITIDFLLLGLIEMLILIVIDQIFSTNLFEEFWSDSAQDDGSFWLESGLLEPAVYFGVISEMLIFFSINGYFLYTRGQSLGKMAMNIVIVDARSIELSSFPNLFLFRYLPFWGAIVISPIVYVLYVVIDACFIFGDERRTIHDRLARTAVLDLGKLSAGEDSTSETN